MLTNVELHDASVVALVWVGTKLTVKFEYVCVHTIVDMGADPICSGYSASMEFYNAKLVPAQIKVPFCIADGDLILGGKKLGGYFPIPLFESIAELMLVAVYDSGEPVVIKITAEKMTISLSERPLFCEEGP